MNRTMNSTFHHSSFYHKYYKNYYEERVPKKNKKGYKIVRTYIGPIIQNEDTDTVWVRRKVLYLAMSFGSLALYISCARMDADFNRCWYVALPGIVSFLLLLTVLAVAIDYASKPRKMTEYDYETGPKRIETISLAASVPLLLEAISIGCYMIFFHINLKYEAVGLLLILAAVIPVCVIHRIEKKTQYVFYENSSKPIGEGVIIE